MRATSFVCVVSKTGKEHVTIARVVDAFGVRGHIKVRTFTEKPQNLLNYTCWVLNKKGKDQLSFSVTSSRLHGKFITAKLEGVDNRDQAIELKGADILIAISELPELPDGQFYHFQLSGLAVVDVDGYSYGCVEEIMQTGANDVLVVKGLGTHLIPYTPDAILQVDLKAGKILVEWFVDI